MSTEPLLPVPDLLDTLHHYLGAGRRMIVTAAHPEQSRALLLAVLGPLAGAHAESGDVIDRVTADRIELRNGGLLLRVAPRPDGSSVRGMVLDVAVLLDLPADHPFRAEVAPCFVTRDGFVIDVDTSTL